MQKKGKKAFSSLLYGGLPKIKVSLTPPAINVGVRYLISKLIATKNTGISKEKESAMENVFATSTFFLSWLVSLIGRALHRYRRGQGFESRTSLNFVQAFFSQLHKLRI